MKSARMIDNFERILVIQLINALLHKTHVVDLANSILFTQKSQPKLTLWKPGESVLQGLSLCNRSTSQMSLVRLHMVRSTPMNLLARHIYPILT